MSGSRAGAHRVAVAVAWVALAGCVELGKAPTARPEVRDAAVADAAARPPPDLAVELPRCVRDPDTEWSACRVIGHADSNAARSIARPTAVATHPLDGRLYVGARHRVLRVEADGAVIAIAGTGVPGYEGDGGPASHALLNEVRDLDFDPMGRLYIVDGQNQVVRRVELDGTIETYAGTGEGGALPRGAGGEVIETGRRQIPLQWLQSVAVAADGTLYLAPGNDRAILQVDPAGRVTALIDADVIRQPRGLALPPDGRALFVGLAHGGRVIRVDLDDPQTPPVIAGPPREGDPDTRLATPYGLAVDAAGVVYVADPEHSRVLRARPLDAETYAIERFAGDELPASEGDGGPALDASLHFPHGLAVDTDGALLIAEHHGHRIRRAGPDGQISTVAGTGAPPPAALTTTTSTLDAIGAVLAEPDGAFLFATAEQIWRRDPTGGLEHIAGTTRGFFGDGGPASAARFDGISALARRTNGDLLVADAFNQRVRRISAAGRVTTIAGNGEGIDSEVEPASEERPPTEIEVVQPAGLAVGADGAVTLSEHQTHRLRRLWTDDAGTTHLRTRLHREDSAEVSALIDDDLYFPTAVITAPVRGGVEHVCYADSANPANGLAHPVTCIAPDGALVRFPPSSDPGDPVEGVPLGGHGLGWTGEDLLVTSRFDHALYRVDPTPDLEPEAAFERLVGDGRRGAQGDGGPAGYARLAEPHGLDVDARGGVLIADFGTHRVRRLDPDGAIETLLGWLDPLGVGPRERAWAQAPTALTADGDGGWWITGGATGRLYHLPPAHYFDNGLRVAAGRPAGFADVTAWREAWGAPSSVALPAIHARRFRDPIGVARDWTRGEIYVLEHTARGGASLQRFSLRDDTLRQSWSAPEDRPPIDLAFAADLDAMFVADAEGLWRVPTPVGEATRTTFDEFDGLRAVAYGGGVLAVIARTGLWTVCLTGGCSSRPRRIVDDAMQLAAVDVDAEGAVYYADAAGLWHATPDEVPRRLHTAPAGRIVDLAATPDGHVFVLEADRGALFEVSPPP